MTVTTRDVRKQAADLFSGYSIRMVDALDWATTKLGGSTDLFHETNEELRQELEVASLAMWEAGRSREEIVAALPAEELARVEGFAARKAEALGGEPVQAVSVHGWVG